MRTLKDYRSGKPGYTPDQSIYAEYACAEFGLTFQELDGGTGLVFSVSSLSRSITFGAGRCSWYPQNNSTAASLATDKYFAKLILEPPASRRSAVDTSSCMTGIGHTARRVTNAATRWITLRSSAVRHLPSH